MALDRYRRPARPALQQVADLLAENRVGRQPDGIAEPFLFQKLVYVRTGEGGIGPEIPPPQRLPSVTLDDWRQDIAPAVRARDVAGPRRAAFEIAVLVEHEDRVVADATEIAVIRGAFLVAMNRALGTVDVEDQRRRSAPSPNLVDPRTVQAQQRREVPLVGQNSGLEAAHLALARGVAIVGATTDNAAHDRIARQPIGVVHVLITGQAPEHGLSEQGEQGVLRVPTRAAVAQFPTRYLGQAQGLIQLPKQQQPAV